MSMSHTVSDEGIVRYTQMSSGPFLIGQVESLDPVRVALSNGESRRVTFANRDVTLEVDGYVLLIEVGAHVVLALPLVVK